MARSSFSIRRDILFFPRKHPLIKSLRFITVALTLVGTRCYVIVVSLNSAAKIPFAASRNYRLDTYTSWSLVICGTLRIKIILSFDKLLYFGRKLYNKLPAPRVSSKFREKCSYSLQTTLNQSNRFNELYWINVNGTISRFFQTASVAVSMGIYDKSLLSLVLPRRRKLFTERLMKTNCVSNHWHGDSLRRHAPSDITDKESHDTVRV